MALTVEAASRIQCDRLMLVENLATFRNLERNPWLRLEGKRVLVIYRGDRLFNLRDAQLLIRERKEPIWAFFDFDPKGLMMANALPHDRLEKIVVPDLDTLAGLCDTTRGRKLFHDQVAGCQAQLDASQHPAVVPLWALMKRLHCGATQERMSSISVGRQLFADTFIRHPSLND